MHRFYPPDMRWAHKLTCALIFPLIKYERACMGSVFSMHGSIHACIDLIARVYRLSMSSIDSMTPFSCLLNLALFLESF